MEVSVPELVCVSLEVMVPSCLSIQYMERPSIDSL